jgi:hypothetical protein
MTAGPHGGRFAADPYAPPYSAGVPTAGTPAEPVRVTNTTAKLETIGGVAYLVARITPPATEQWRIFRLSVMATDTPGSAFPVHAAFPNAYFYVTAAGEVPSAPRCIAGSTNGWIDEYSDSTGVVVPPGSQVVVLWTTNLGSATIRVEYQREL